MKEFIDKLISRLEEREVQAYAKTDGGATYTAYRNAIGIVDQLAEEYKTTYMEELLKAKRICANQCTPKCPFILEEKEGKCFLEELQNKLESNGWIPCSSGVLPVGKEYEIYDEEEDITYHKHVWVKTDNVNIPYCVAFYDTDCWFDAVTNVPISVVAWQNIAPYQPKGE